MSIDLLRGAIDTHVHSYPDVIRRKLDDVELVEQARAAGMRAMLLKSHHSPTCDRAYLLNRFYPDFQTFGGIALNDTVGGFNPRAVETALRMGGVNVWMPTFSAANHRKHLGGTGVLTLCDGQGVRAEIGSILRLIADADASLATGHLAPEETNVLIQAALDAGVRRIVVTHPEWGVTAVKVEDQLRFAATGCVYFERCLVSISPDLREHVSFQFIVEQIRAVGCETTIIATDYGMPQYPTPIEGMQKYIQLLQQAGFQESEIKQMAQDNPARLLKLQDGVPVIEQDGAACKCVEVQ